MDVTPFTDELFIAPQAVFDRLPEKAAAPRFMVPTGDGDWEAVTWGGFARQIRQAALYLDRVGLAGGQRAAVFAPNSVSWMSAALGIQAAGGAMVPIYHSSTPDQAGYVVEHSDAKVVFIDTEALLERALRAWDNFEAVERVVLLGAIDAQALVARLKAQGVSLPGWEQLERRLVGWSQVMAMGAAAHQDDEGAFDRLMNGVSLDQPGVMLYTSGTSGRPKGVPLTHRNVGVNGRDWMVCNAPLLDEGMTDLLWLPMSHVFGFGEACLGNTLGFTSYMCDPYNVLGLLQEVRPSVFMSVPSYWEKLAMAAMEESDPEARRQRLMEVTGGRLRFCLSGGAGLKRQVKELFHEAGVLIIEGYGLTEASPTLTLNRADAFRFDSVGQPLPSVELRLADDGEILARGESIFGGYHKDPEATAECFTDDGWLKTGDVGRFTDDGFLQIVDRKKDILVTAGGKNVAPANIELCFRDDPVIEHLVVYGDGQRFLSAGVWVWAHAAAAHSPEALEKLVQARIDQANAELARHETLKRFVIMDTPLTVESGFLTPTLKVKRKKVYEAFGERLAALYD